METRTNVEVKVFVLFLNNMQNRAESATDVAMSYSKEKLKEWYQSQLASEPYSDDGINNFSGSPTKWHRIFKAESPLYWYNGVSDLELENGKSSHFGHGIFEVWSTEDVYNNFRGNKIEE